jgi:glutamate-1-semialdehyde 2,1-aminomutase
MGVERAGSQRLFDRARRVIPGGVNSPVRAFRGVGGTPVFFKEGRGAWLTDVDGHRYVDHVGSWGPLILGHAFPPIVDAVTTATHAGTSFGAPHAGEVDLAELICQRMPAVEEVRLTSSGTESTLAALRVARAYTGREVLVKFEGCYHGAGDPFLVKAGSGVETLGLPDSPGVPRSLAALTLTLPFNDLAAARELFGRKGKEIAAVIIEPVVGNMGVLVPRAGFLEGLVDLCREAGALLIFDEVMTGFRLAKGGAQELFGLIPDLTTMGKVIGGGLPVGAYGGRRAIMETVAPAGPVYQAGTLSGNPLAVAAGLACLRALGEPGIYDKLDRISRALTDGLLSEARAAGVPVTLNRVGSMWTLFFTEGPVFDYPSAKRADTKKFGSFFHALLDRGVYLPPSQFEAAFVSLAMGEREIEHTLAAARQAFRTL